MPRSKASCKGTHEISQYIIYIFTSLETANDDAGEKKQDWMQKLAMRMLHLNDLQQPSLCRFFATRCYYRFWGSGLLTHLILLILLSSPSNHILEACRSQAHVDHISRLCGLGSMPAKTAMIFQRRFVFAFLLFCFWGLKS